MTRHAGLQPPAEDPSGGPHPINILITLHEAQAPQDRNSLDLRPRGQVSASPMLWPKNVS